MSCGTERCGCGKNDQTLAQEQLVLTRLSSEKGMLSTHNWMGRLTNLKPEEEVIEVRFRNNRKEFFRNGRNLRLNKDDWVVVDMEDGYDVGTVSVTGTIAKKQFEKKGRGTDLLSLKQVCRVASEADMKKWIQVRKKERTALIRCREIAASLNPEMSIGDVEFRVDGKRLTIYCSNDGSVEYSELLEYCMNEFKTKIELRQKGAGQNTAKRGNRGSCGCKTDSNEPTGNPAYPSTCFSA
jgi:cell fate regulator YaaT (PSP1 superfamily)